MNKTKLSIAMLALMISFSKADAFTHPVTITDQGSFFAGGTVVTADGEYKKNEPLNFDGHTLHGDHAYVFYQIPKDAHKLALVFLHGAGQSGKTWETTPDGRDGFANIFLEKKYKTYVVDQPRRGRAGRSTVAENISANPDDQLWFNTFRIGVWPDYYENAAVSRDPKVLDQFLRQMTPNTGVFDNKVITSAMIEVMKKSGDSILVTHSQGGGPGWSTAVSSDNVKAVVAMEPGAFPFPKGEVPEVEKTSSPFPAQGTEYSKEDFLKLIKKPIIVYFGDNIPDEPTDNFGQDNWRVRQNLAVKFMETAKKYGGDVTIVKLPEVGIKGNTHFMFADLNNTDIAEHLEKWIKDRKLDR